MNLFLASLLAAILFAASSTPAASLRVVAATNDLGAIARAVGGDAIELDVVARPDRDPHSLPVLPSTMRATARADMYLEIGLSLDLWSREIIRGSRNRKLTVVDCSRVITPLEVPVGRVDASQGDVHPEGNPHYWLDPANAVLVAELLAREFAAIDAERATDYEARMTAFRAEIGRRLPEWSERLRGRRFVEFHRSWVYLAARFEMEIAGRVEPLPGIPPSAHHLADLASMIRETNVPIAIRDAYHDPSAMEFLARETGVSTAVLPTSCGEPTPESFLAHFDEIAAVLGAPAAEARP